MNRAGSYSVLPVLIWHPKVCFGKVSILLLTTLSIMCAGGNLLAQGNTQQQLLYGVFPYLPAINIELLHAPVAKRFSEILERKIKLNSRPNFESFRNAVEEELFDIIYIQPFGYVRVAAPHNYIPITRFVSLADKKGLGVIKARFVTLADSPVKSVTQLRGKIIAMPPHDAAVSLLGRSYLKEKGIKIDKDVEIKYLRNHFSCIQQLVISEAQACVTALPAVVMFEASKNIKLKVVDQTSAIPSTLYAIHERVHPAIRNKIKQEILSWNLDDKGNIFLRQAKLKRFIPASDDDYEPVRKLWAILEKDIP